MDVRFEAQVRYKRGMDLDQLMDDLIAEGAEPKAAEEAVMAVHKRIKAGDRRRGFHNLIFGLIILVISGGVAFWALANGGVMLLAWGGVLVGGGMTLTGVAQISSAGQDRELARR